MAGLDVGLGVGVGLGGVDVHAVANDARLPPPKASPARLRRAARRDILLFNSQPGNGNSLMAFLLFDT